MSDGLKKNGEVIELSFGGGSFVSENKVLPGVYVNVGAGMKSSLAVADRGVAALGLELSWGPEGELIYLTEGDFRKEALRRFGYSYADEAMKGLRDLFKHAAGCYLYRLNGGEKAANDYCEAKYSGARGNAVSIVISGGDDLYSVATLVDGREVDVQSVGTAAELQDNDFVCWKREAELAATAGTPLTGGLDKKAEAEDYAEMFTALEGVSFNTLGCLATDRSIKQLFVQYTKEQREDNGKKFQTVMYREAADYEGVISVENKAEDGNYPESAAVYWFTGAEAGCAVNCGLTNAGYDGELNVIPLLGQEALKEAMQQGRIVLHRQNGRIKVLEDINSLVSVNAGGRSEDMRFNQTVRVLDQIVSDLSTLFYEKYLGVMLNDNAGRLSLWNDIVSYYRKLESLRAIENFDPADISVEQGDRKNAVKINSYLTVINAMSQLYLTVTFE